LCPTDEFVLDSPTVRGRRRALFQRPSPEGLLGAIVVQGLAANTTNVYTAGLSLVNTVPRLGRLWATVAVAVGAVALSGFPDFVDHAQRWITHLGNLAAPCPLSPPSSSPSTTPCRRTG